VRPDSLVVAACVTHWISADCRPHPGFSRERVIAQYLRHLGGMGYSWRPQKNDNSKIKKILLEEESK